jgi:hypothetical protein
MTIIECSKCTRNMWVTQTSVTLPFVCLRCEAAQAARADRETAIELAQEVSAQGAPSDSQESHDSHDSCDSATVDNTTQLIVDLEFQLAAERVRAAEAEIREGEAKLAVAEIQERLDLQSKSFDNALQTLETVTVDRDFKIKAYETRIAGWKKLSSNRFKRILEIDTKLANEMIRSRAYSDAVGILNKSVDTLSTLLKEEHQAKIAAECLAQRAEHRERLAIDSEKRTWEHYEAMRTMYWIASRSIFTKIADWFREQCEDCR